MWGEMALRHRNLIGKTEAMGQASLTAFNMLSPVNEAKGLGSLAASLSALETHQQGQRNGIDHITKIIGEFMQA